MGSLNCVHINKSRPIWSLMFHVKPTHQLIPMLLHHKGCQYSTKLSAVTMWIPWKKCMFLFDTDAKYNSYKKHHITTDQHFLMQVFQTGCWFIQHMKRFWAIVPHRRQDTKWGRYLLEKSLVSLAQLTDVPVSSPWNAKILLYLYPLWLTNSMWHWMSSMNTFFGTHWRNGPHTHTD